MIVYVLSMAKPLYGALPRTASKPNRGNCFYKIAIS